jgi:hypothetical protein
LLGSPPGAAEVGAREWQAEGSVLTDSKATRRKAIVIRAIAIALLIWLAVAFVEAARFR